MFGCASATRTNLGAGATDLRQGFEDVYGPVRDRLRREPLSGHGFLFSNAHRNRLKLLLWGHDLPSRLTPVGWAKIHSSSAAESFAG